MTRKPVKVSPADLLELLLDSDEMTRKLLIFEALQTGALGKSEAEQIIELMVGLESAPASAPVTTMAKAQVA